MADENTLELDKVHDLLDWYTNQIKNYQEERNHLVNKLAVNLTVKKDFSEEENQMYLDEIGELDRRIENLKLSGQTFCSQHIPSLEEIDNPFERYLLKKETPKVWIQ